MHSKIKRISIKRIISIFFAITFLLGLLFVQRNYAKADDSIITYEDNIKVLEIEPGNKFLLEDSGIGDINKYEGMQKVQIKHVTMAQFISMVDEIDGQYDAVVIGRSNYGLKAQYSKGTAYRDYTNPFSQAIDYLPLSTWSKDSNWQKNYKNNVDNSQLAEYYSENDITKKKADEIQTMIKKGQLVYMDSQIGSEDIKYTKLYNLYSQSEGSNLVKTSKENITLQKIVEEYGRMNSELKRPKVSKVVKPLDDKSSTPSKDREMQFTVNINDYKSEKLKLRLYLDINADGLFKDKELVETYDFQTDGDGKSDFTFKHDLDKNFIGYLDWKIEIIRENGIKTNLIGSSQYKSLIGPKQIRVLQIIPDEANLIDLSKNQLITDPKVKEDYKLVIETKKVRDVNTQGKSFKLNGNYDMVILGFADSYGFKQLNSDVVDEIEAFIRTGQSVMFTHDTITPALADSLHPETGQDSTGPRLLTQRFRDYVGQARYVDPYRVKSGEASNDIYKQYEIKRDENDNITNMTLKDKSILHDYFYGTGNLNSGSTGIKVSDDSDYYKSDNKRGSAIQPYSLGTTFQGHVVPAISKDFWGREYYSSDWDWNNSWNYISRVKKVNSAQINQYPFQLRDNMDVALTHTQWYQLNLEDPDVVPWFNLEGGNFDTGDSRNFYYTYSKGNITYSGTGHSGGFPDEEQKLFINTMIKAERGANHAPIINCSIPLESSDKSEQINQVRAGRDYYFSIDADDYEKDIVNMHVTINGAEVNSSNVVTKTELSQENNEKLFKIETSNSNRTSIKFKIPSQQLQETDKNTSIVIEAEDIQGAKSSKKYVIKPVRSICSIDADFVSATPNTADSEVNIDVKYRITPNDYYYNDSLNSKGAIDEAVFLIDLSKSMSNNQCQRFSEFKNGIMKVLDDQELQKNIKLGVVGYNSSVLIGDRKDQNDPKSVKMKQENEKLIKPLCSISDSNERDGFRMLFQQDENLTRNISSSDDARNLDSALKMGDSILTSYGEVNKKKAIVIISSGELSYSNEEIRAIRSKGYKIITLDISSNGDKSNIKNAHLSLGGDPKDYFSGKTDNGGNYNSVGDDMKNVEESLKSGAAPLTSIINNAKFDFDLGDNFQPVNDKAENYEQLVNTAGTSYTVDLTSKIKYTKTNDKDSEGKTKYTAQPFDITFKIKSSVGKYGNLGFSGLVFKDDDYANNQLAIYGTDLAKNNNFVYEDINGVTTNPIKTPVVKIRLDLDHGVYKSFNDQTGIATVDNGHNNKPPSFPLGSVVTFASNISKVKGNIAINLKIDDNLEMNSLPTLYEYKNGTLSKLKGSDNNEITLSQVSGQVNQYKRDNILLSDKSNIIVLYSVKLKATNNSDYRNNIWINDGDPVEALITQSNNPLPDLF